MGNHSALELEGGVGAILGGAWIRLSGFIPALGDVGGAYAREMGGGGYALRQDIAHGVERAFLRRAPGAIGHRDKIRRKRSKPRLAAESRDAS